MSSAVRKHARVLISVNAAAGRVGLDPRTIRRYISDGVLPAYRVGTTLIRLDQADVDALVQPIAAVNGAGR